MDATFWALVGLVLFIAVVAVLSIAYSHTTVHGYHARLNGLSADFAKAELFVKRR